MSLSKPFVDLLTSYLIELYSNPLRTKAITSSIVATVGNVLSQKIQGSKRLDQDSMLAYALFGFFIAGPIPHYFHIILEKLFLRSDKLFLTKKLIVERLIFMPLFNLISLYTIPRLEGKTHEEAVAQVKRLYKIVIQENWKYLTLVQYLNIKYVPPMLRVLVGNFIGLIWCIHMANRRAKANKKAKTN